MKSQLNWNNKIIEIQISIVKVSEHFSKMLALSGVFNTRILDATNYANQDYMRVNYTLIVVYTMLLVTGSKSKTSHVFAWIWPNSDRWFVNHCALPSIGQTWVLASIGAVVEMGVLSTLKRLLMVALSHQYRFPPRDCLWWHCMAAASSNYLMEREPIRVRTLQT
jgi:hypothetical protein